MSDALGSVRAQVLPCPWPTVSYVPPVVAWAVTHSPEEHGIILASRAFPETSVLGTSRESSFITCFSDVSACTKVEKIVNAASGMMSVQRSDTLPACSPWEGWALRQAAAVCRKAVHVTCAALLLPCWWRHGRGCCRSTRYFWGPRASRQPWR